VLLHTINTKHNKVRIIQVTEQLNKTRLLVYRVCLVNFNEAVKLRDREKTPIGAKCFAIIISYNNGVIANFVLKILKFGKVPSINGRACVYIPLSINLLKKSLLVHSTEKSYVPNLVSRHVTWLLDRIKKWRIRSPVSGVCEQDCDVIGPLWTDLHRMFIGHNGQTTVC